MMVLSNLLDMRSYQIQNCTKCLQHNLQIHFVMMTRCPQGYCLTELARALCHLWLWLMQKLMYPAISEHVKSVRLCKLRRASPHFTSVQIGRAHV